MNDDDTGLPIVVATSTVIQMSILPMPAWWGAGPAWGTCMQKRRVYEANTTHSASCSLDRDERPCNFLFAMIYRTDFITSISVGVWQKLYSQHIKMQYQKMLIQYT
jgi:hypothetical protein